MPKKGIPDRWLSYKACGKQIEGTNIICFKVPLKNSVSMGKEVWNVETLLAIPGLGAVVDLTNTSRYYNPNEIIKAGLLHKKILMPGREIPNHSVVKEFFDTVDDFMSKSVLVGVHCTHGLNRTGYMVCLYMRDRLGIPGDEAIRRFEEARGYKIERKNYIADILRKVPPPPDFRQYTSIQAVVNQTEKLNLGN